MSDYRNPDFDPYDPNDPNRRGTRLNTDMRPSNAVTGWIVAAVFVVAVLAVIFGLTHQAGQTGTNTASNDVATPPAVSHMTPPATAPQASPSSPAGTKPIGPTTPAPGQSNGSQ
jgi:hypothetical protein